MAVADDSYVAVPPLLVVEGASPTTRDLDGDRKLRAYGQADVAWYWIVERAVVVVPPARQPAAQNDAQAYIAAIE